MRAILITTATMGLVLASGTHIWAGLYNTTEPVEGPTPDAAGVVKPIPAQAFLTILSDLLLIVREAPPSDQRTKVLKQRDELLKKKERGELTVTDRVNLGAAYIRLRDYLDAVDVLSPATRQEPRNIMAASNLATAYQLQGELTTARGALKDAIEIWPKQWPGLTDKQLEWYKRVEGYQLSLIKLRAKEAVQQPQGQVKPTDHVDDLFAVRFIGDSGQYEAGKLAAAEQAKLPPDAVPIVQQLLIWFPDDTRLLWLFAELLNAKGDVEGAKKVFHECVYSRGYNASELREHRQIVNEAKSEVIVEPPSSILPDTRKTLVVGSVAGLIMLGLAFLQIREIRRRRHGTSVSKGY